MAELFGRKDGTSGGRGGSMHLFDGERRFLGGYGIVNLHGQYAIDKGWNLFARANNVFDKRYELRRDYAVAGASVFVGVRYEPQ